MRRLTLDRVKARAWWRELLNLKIWFLGFIQLQLCNAAKSKHELIFNANKNVLLGVIRDDYRNIYIGKNCEQ